MIVIQNMHKKYGKKEVLRDISLQLKPSKIYGVIGKNGAGKTTLFKCIAGLESFEGEVHADEEPLKDYTGFLLTHPYFLPKLTGHEHIKLLMDARSLSYEQDSISNLFNLPLHEYAENYSTGMKKKLALTAILLQKNKVFILDEPFNGVDLESNMLLMKVIRKLRALQKTVIISSHLLSTMRDLCDEIFLLQDGSITKSYMRAEFEVLEDQIQNTPLQSSPDLGFLE